jgi:hypothetical protein
MIDELLDVGDAIGIFIPCQTFILGSHLPDDLFFLNSSF